MYGGWITESRAPGFVLSDQLTVFAVDAGPFLKMVGLQGNGNQEGRNVKNFKGTVTLEDVRKAWENPFQKVGSHYQVKDTSSCSPSKGK